MTLKSGKGRKAGWVLITTIALVAGCSGDIAGEMGRNVQVRERVMGAIASDSVLAGEMATRLLGSDRQRLRVVDKILADDRSAQYVLLRIGQSPTAVDYVLQAAAADSAGREHLTALFKKMLAAMQNTKQNTKQAAKK